MKIVREESQKKAQEDNERGRRNIEKINCDREREIKKKIKKRDPI